MIVTRDESRTRPMLRDLFTVLLCEIGERVLLMRDVLADPAVTTKPHTSAVAALLSRGLDAVEARIQSDIVASSGTGEVLTSLERNPTGAFRVLAECVAALGALHQRLDLVDLRRDVAPVDIFLRKLRDDVGDFPPPAVVLTGEYAAIGADVAEGLRGALARSGVESQGVESAQPVVALPRVEANNPLSWPLLCSGLARLLPRSWQEPSDSALTDVVAAYLGGPAAFAAHAVHALLVTSPTQPVWPELSTFALAAGIDNVDDDSNGIRVPVSGLLADLLRLRDDTLGHPARTAPLSGSYPSPVWPPLPTLPTTAETSSLLEKLVSGTPINAIEPPTPPDFSERLDSVATADEFYALIAPLGERAASLATILGVGWLYKIRHGYTLFGELLDAQGDYAATIREYAPHVFERNGLLVQSIDAAHVQGIFGKERA